MLIIIFLLVLVFMVGTFTVIGISLYVTKMHEKNAELKQEPGINAPPNENDTKKHF